MYRFAKMNGLDLLIGHCPNKHLHIFGFPQQLDGTLNKDAMTYTTAAFLTGMRL